MKACDPADPGQVRFAAACRDFLAGRDNPRAFLERWLEVIAARQPLMKAFVIRDAERACAAADASAKRPADGRPLSPVYNLPLLKIEGVPLDVQLMGFEHRDED